MLQNSIPPPLGSGIVPHDDHDGGGSAYEGI